MRNGNSAVHRPATRWLLCVERWHGADLNPLALVLDGLVVMIAFLIVSASVGDAALAAGAFVLLGPLLGLARQRTTVESQGVLFYARALVPVAVVLFLLSLLRPLDLTPGRGAAGLAVAGASLLAGRIGLWLVIVRARRRGLGLRSTLVVGSTARIEQLQHRLSTYPEAGLRFVAGYTPGQGNGQGPFVSSDIEHIVMVSEGVDDSAFRSFTHPDDAHRGYTLVLPLSHLAAYRWRYHIGDLGVLPLPIGAGARGMVAKRVFDMCASAALLLVVAPVLGITALAIWLHDRGPVVFRQRRVGRNGHPFVMLKFRSMVVDAEAKRAELLDQNINGGLLFKMHHDPRITPVGSVIRRLSIDELPQLVNVLKGDMSLVGPRPLPVDPDDFDGRDQARHAVPPGITGPWQVAGGNALDYTDMVDLDLTYVSTRSFWYDLTLIARTLPALLSRRSAY
jgi:lipopolysaccharide/colanic/teichoic acid biosynthesis glycosyltransferase